jgi:hypothetical protein
MELKKIVSKALFARVDDASLAFFRIAFGAVIAWEMAVYLDKGWAVTAFVLQPMRMNFPFWPFLSLEPLGPWGMRAVFAVTGVGAVSYALGAFQRLAASVMFVGLTYIFVLEKAYYLNHWYLACLLAFLCAVFPPSSTWAVTGKRPPPKTVAAWPVSVLRAQLAIVYIFAGITKMNPDWIRGIPLRGWLRLNADIPAVGPLFELPETAIVMAWAGMLLDLLGPFGLLWRRTRLITFTLFVGFHLSNSRLFDLGMFPWFALVATTIFFEPSWPRELVDCVRKRGHRVAILSGTAMGAALAAVVPRHFGTVPVLVGAAIGACWAFHFVTRRKGRTAPDQTEGAVTPVRTNRFVTAFVVGWLLIQVAVPMRHFFIPGDVMWTEEGHRFSWRMMARHKSGSLTYRVVDQGAGEEFVVPPDVFLSWKQKKEIAYRPDMIVQFAHWLEGVYQRHRGPGPYSIYADTEVSLNFRPKKPLVDSTVDLTQVELPWRPPAPWITSAPPRAEHAEIQRFFERLP